MAFDSEQLGILRGSALALAFSLAAAGAGYSGVIQANSGGPTVNNISLAPSRMFGMRLLFGARPRSPARRSLRSGLRYVIVGEPVKAKANVQLVTRFPEAGLAPPSTAFDITAANTPFRV